MAKLLLAFIMSFIALEQCCANQNDMQDDFSKILGERVDGPANVRDKLNRDKILFSLDDNLLVECTDEINGWYKIGLTVKLNTKQNTCFKFEKGDTLFDVLDNKIGIVINEIPILLPYEKDGLANGFIVGYTKRNNIKPESIIENVLSEIINKNEGAIDLNNLNSIISSFQMRSCSSTCMGTEKGEWFYYEDNLLDDISPRDRITLMIEDKILIGLVHSRKIDFKNRISHELIRGHKFTPIAKLSDSEINEIINERIQWYNSID